MQAALFTLFVCVSLYAIHRLAALITRQEERAAARRAAAGSFAQEPHAFMTQALKDAAAALVLAVLGFGAAILVFAY